MSRNKWVGLVVVVALVGAVTWYFASPWYTLMQIRDAARTNDADSLSAYIDYESLREDLKSEFMARMMAEAQKDQSEFGALGMAIGSAMVGPIVDGMISPAGVRGMLLADERRKKATAGQPVPPVSAGPDPVVERRNFSEFAVKSKDKAEGAMIFTRHGLGWKLSGVDLPPPTEE